MHAREKAEDADAAADRCSDRFSAMERERNHADKSRCCEERQIAEAIRLSALEAAPEEVLMTDAAATGARRLNRRRGSSDPDERMTSGSGSRKTD